MVSTRRTVIHNSRLSKEECKRNSIMRVSRSSSYSPVCKRSNDMKSSSLCSSERSKLKQSKIRELSSSPEIPLLYNNENDFNDRGSPEISHFNECNRNRKELFTTDHRSNDIDLAAKVNGKQSKITYSKLIPDYFPLRKSQRLDNIMEQLKMKKQIEHSWVEAVLNCAETGFIVRHMADKGRGVFASRVFQKDDFVLEYAGTLRSLKEARQYEKLYAENQALGCFMFYFKYLCKSYCIDATEETRRLGRLVNHSRYKNNLIPKVVSINGYPHLILIASKRIEIGEELLYDYGDRSATSLRAHPWLAT